MHHCMVDGASGMDLSQILMSTQPKHELQAPGHYVPRDEPSGWELVRAEWGRRLRLPLTALRSLRELRDETDDLRGEIGLRLRSLGALLGWAVRGPSDTPLNVPIGPHRRFDWLDMSLADVKAVRRALGCSVNDVVLAVVTGAVREFLLHRFQDPDAIDFRVSAPVSVRSDGERGVLGNRVSTWILRLPVGVADPLKQLDEIHDSTLELKESRQALGAEMIMAVAEWTPSILLSLGARAASTPIPVNMMVTNVPGPQFPLYLLGAEMLAAYPAVPLMERTALGVALMSYNGLLCWGFNADYDAVPDLGVFTASIERAFEKLAAAAGVALEDRASAVPRPIPAPAPRTRRSRGRSAGAAKSGKQTPPGPAPTVSAT
jgi:WS/DGAT/MGAT family acyltransferase